MPPSTIAGRYRVLREVGRGASGGVWLCRDERLGRDVAVKQVGRLPGGSVPDLARAMREAKSTAALNHPHVVAVYDAIEEGDHIWLVMEYVAGRTLARMVAEDGPLPPERAARIGAQVADGLTAAHARGTVHRDVKPGNILVTEDDRAKISDFGIARTRGEEQLTESGLMTGTPAYFSPELARGDDPTPASDVWALGATLYAAVEGRPPYPDRPNALALLATIASERPPRPARAGALEEAIGRMMDPEPSSRWEMADCAHALHRLHASVASRDATREEEVEAPPAPSAAASPRSAAAPRSAADPGPAVTTRRRRRPAALVLVLVLLLAAGGLGWLLLRDSDGDGAGPPAAGPTGTGGAAEPGERTTGPTREADPTTATPAPEPPASEAGPASRTAFVEDYYAALPEDTETGWSQLSAAYQDETGDYGDYAGFWSTIDALSVEGTRPAGPAAVDVTLTYVSDGRSEREVRRIHLRRTQAGFLITRDEVVG
jgi:hypothetical protein